MRVLFVHNYYQQTGGEDQVFDIEGKVLEHYGHEVIRFTIHNDDITNLSTLQLARATLWNSKVTAQLQDLIQRKHVELVHFHNTFPLVSPGAYHAVKSLNMPVVQRLPNYRLLCPRADFLRNGRICEDCMGKMIPYPSLLHACYRNSRLATSGVFAMLAFHRFIKTWEKKVDLFIALTEFGKRKFIEGGLPEEKVYVKPNMVHPDPGPGTGKGNYAIFIGRLAPEKGIDTLLDAWNSLNGSVRLKIIGNGPLSERVSKAASDNPTIEWLGFKPRTEIFDLMKNAALLIFPSIWYEGLPMTIIEAFSTGLPVLTSRMGSMTELVKPGHNGLHFQAGDAADLAEKTRWFFGHSQERQTMRRHAREEYEKKYGMTENYPQLMAIYDRAKAINQNTVMR